MAINVSFNGATIYRPGGYSKETIDVGGGFPIGPTGLVAIFGEADAGTPGASEVDIRNNRFSADQMQQIRDKYRSGPIADAAGFLFAPAADANIPSGASTVWIYKTNASTQASKALATSYGTVKAREWGIGGNRCTVAVSQTSEVRPTVTGSTIAAFGVPLNDLNFLIIENGGSPKTITLSSDETDHDDIDALVSELSALFLAATLSLTVAKSGSKLVISAPADASQHKKGWGKSFEIVSGTGLTALGLTAALTTSSTETMQIVKVQQRRDLLIEEESVGGNIVMTIGHDDTATSATVTINEYNVVLTPSPGTAITLPKAAYTTVKDLADDINLRTGWSAAVTTATYNQLSPEVLDHVTNVGALSLAGMPARIKKDAAEVASFFDSSLVTYIDNQISVGLPDALTETNLTGGAKGGTNGAEIIAALEKFTKFHVNFVVPLFSRDAVDDIDDGLTDGTSTYTIDAIHQAVKTHISLMKTTKKKSERQGCLSLKKSYVDCKEKAGDLADGRQQLVIQDVRQVDAQGNIKWFQPWAMASMVAGARCGCPIGTPLTFKFLNVSGIRHTAQPMSTPEADIVIDFDPDLQGDEAIQSGITFMENRQGGGYRIVVDNTTYGKDGNFVWNRGNVIYAADVVAFNFRQGLEDVYVGQKNTVTNAEVAGTAASILSGFRTQGITVSTPDAPEGYKNLQVTVSGNVINVSVTIKIVEGIDFILADITIQRAQQ